MDIINDVTPQQSSNIRRFYRGTQIQVRLGDRVRIRLRFKRFIDGTFCYVPGESRPDQRLRRDWVIKADHGKVLSECDLPGSISSNKKYPSRFAELSKRITFIRRREPADPDPENLLPPPPHSLMFYRSGEEILIGDRVRFRSIFTRWRCTEARISYIPGISTLDNEFEEGGLDWALTTDDGNIYAGSAYCPGHIIKSLTFIRRAEGK